MTRLALPAEKPHPKKSLSSKGGPVLVFRLAALAHENEDAHQAAHQHLGDSRFKHLPKSNQRIDTGKQYSQAG